MSKDDNVTNGVNGIPGYTSNNSVPGSFELPLPVAGTETSERVDPWTSTWDTSSWQVPTVDPTLSPENPTWSDPSAQNEPTAADWTSGEAGRWESTTGAWDTRQTWQDETGQTAEQAWPDTTAAAAGWQSDTGSWDAGASWDSSATWEGDAGTAAQAYGADATTYGGEAPAYGTGFDGAAGYDTGGYPTTSDYSTGSYETGGYATGGYETDTGSYQGWTPQGFDQDHSAAQQAHAATPAVDPDVAALAEEQGYDAYDYAQGYTETDTGGFERPSADDLITVRSRGERQKSKATGGLRKAFGLGPSQREMLERERIDRIARPLGGRKTIMVINTKGGGGKTLVTLMLASYLGRYRSGSVLAWDNNETEGTLGMRAPSQPHHRTVVDFLGALPQIRANPNAGPSDLAHWVREQRGLSFDVLASADDDEAMRIVGEQEFSAVHDQLSRFYRMIIVDTGNNRLAPNWLAAASRADMLVFATSLKDDTSVVAAKNLDALVTMGRGDLVRNAVCVISHTTARGSDLGAGVHTREHFEQWVRAVVDIPYDPALAPGLHLDPLKISRKTHESCMEMAAVVVDGL